MLNLVLFGPPGSGKSTQSRRLAGVYELIHLSTGDLLRNEIANGSQLGLEAQELIAVGTLVPDSVVIGMAARQLDEHPTAHGFIFDGFPRTVAQAQALDELLLSRETAITKVIALETNDALLEQRLLGRGAQSGRSDDVDPVIIRKRINEYYHKTEPIVAFYRKQGKFQSVDGTGSVDEVFTAICAKIDAM